MTAEYPSNFSFQANLQTMTARQANAFAGLVSTPSKQD